MFERTYIFIYLFALEIDIQNNKYKAGTLIHLYNRHIAPSRIHDPNNIVVVAMETHVIELVTLFLANYSISIGEVTGAIQCAFHYY